MTHPTSVHTDPFVQQLMTKGPCYACNVGRCSSGLAVGGLIGVRFQLSQNPAQRIRMGAAGRRYAEQHLHTDAVLGQFVARVGALVATRHHG